MFKYIPLNIYAHFRPAKQCWLITERSGDARDNGWVLFKWLRENHPEINVIYAIHKNAPDYVNVKDLGKVVEFGSWKHWLIFMTCSITCSTDWSLGIPSPLCYLMMRNIFPPCSKRVFLQHGIIKDYMPQGAKNKLHADIFVCGAYPEWEYLTQVYGYTEGEVKYLGLCRYDRLINSSNKRQILFMPTWRAYLGKVDDFEESNYYKKIKSLLCSSKLKSYLENTDTEFIYFIHPAIKNKKKYFEKFQDERIRVLNNDDDDMQKYICSANMLITDFSSIYFDFAYQGKPVLYYHFDYEFYRKGHYAEGYFSYENDGFGPIVKDESSLIEMIKIIGDNNWNLNGDYGSRIYRFFPMRDKNNCQRHFDELCKLESIIK